ncbi:hypothetical protein F5B18DRAFT_675637, partial [Nemania serpens]
KHGQENNTNPCGCCGYCGEFGHKAAVCDQVGPSGWMEACCKCDSMQHAYEKCPRRRQEEDFTYLILNRGNKSPVKCSLSLGQVVLSELRRQGSPYKDDQIVALPYSPVYAEQAKRTNVGGATKLLINGEEIGAVRSLSEPSRQNVTLAAAVSVLRYQFWTNEDHGFDDTMEYCENCKCIGHSIYNCASPCGFCGKDSHKTMSCNAKHKACLCEKYPRHSRQKCDQICKYCYLENKGESVRSHRIEECPRGCHYCLGPGHKVGRCQKIAAVDDRECARCPGGAYHFPLIHSVCPVADCTSRLKCMEHCYDCGWELNFDKVLEKEGMPKHTCQWKPDFNFFWTSSQGVELICTKNALHKKVTAVELVRSRLETLGALVSAAAAGIKMMKHPIECRQCRDDDESNLDKKSAKNNSYF